MKIQRLIIGAASLIAISQPVQARGHSCTGNSLCRVCTNCNACDMCKVPGRYCGVCLTQAQQLEHIRAGGSVSDFADGKPLRRRTAAQIKKAAADKWNSPQQQYLRTPARQPLPSGKWTPPDMTTSAQRMAKMNAQLEAEAAREERARTAAIQPRPAAAKPAKAPAALTLLGRCVGVHDGDTITILVNKRQIKVRLYGVDAPELKQAFGEKSKQFTSGMTFGKDATVYSKGIDRYGRTLGWVFVGGQCVNKELVSAGFAWWYQQYAPKDIKLGELEARARQAKSGLWSEENPVAPWAFRN